MDIDRIINSRVVKIKYIFKVYDTDFTEIDDISKYIVGAPNISIEADNDVRRSCDFNLVASKKFNSSWIWTNKILSISINLYKDYEADLYEREDLGYYVISSVTETDTLESHLIHVSCVDFMGLLNGTVNGVMLGNGADEYIIPAGSGSIKNIITQTILDSGIFQEWQKNRIFVPDIKIITDSEETDKTPYDISVSVGSTYYDLLKEIMTLTPNIQMFFDKHGSFIVTEIPNGIDEPISITNEQMQKIIIGEERSLDYGSIKNTIEIYGEQYNSDMIFSILYTDGSRDENGYIVGGHTAYVVCDTDTWTQGYADKQNENMIITITKNDIIIVDNQNENLTNFTYDTIVVLDSITIEGREYDEQTYSPQGGIDDKNYYTATSIKEAFSTEDHHDKTGLQKYTVLTTINIQFTEFPNINGITYKYAYDTDNVPANCYLCNFRLCDNTNNIRNVKRAIFLAFQPYCKIEETNTASPYHKNKIGVRRVVLTGGDYENIYCQSLANDRAKYELYNLCRVNDSVTVECIALYGIDVNQLIELELDSEVLGENDTTSNLFMIKSISYSELTMSLTLNRYYPNIENIV